MIHFSRRGRLASMMVGALAAALMAPTTAPVGAATVSTADRAAAPSPQVVLKSDFGKAKSLVEGTFRNGSGTAVGTFTPRRFLVDDAGVMKVAGVVNAKLTYASGRVERISERVRTTVDTANGAPVAGPANGAAARTAARAATCDVLNLVLGPLDLDVLGLQVSLNKLVLKIVAVSGAGNLLGNLLCAVVGLLDNGGLLAEVSNILNAILAILRL